MDEIDQNCWVLEPEHPTKADISRRVALGEDMCNYWDHILSRLYAYICTTPGEWTHAGQVENTSTWLWLRLSSTNIILLYPSNYSISILKSIISSTNMGVWGHVPSWKFWIIFEMHSFWVTFNFFYAGMPVPSLLYSLCSTTWRTPLFHPFFNWKSQKGISLCHEFVAWNYIILQECKWYSIHHGCDLI